MTVPRIIPAILVLAAAAAALDVPARTFAPGPALASGGADWRAGRREEERKERAKEKREREKKQPTISDGPTPADPTASSSSSTKHRPTPENPVAPRPGGLAP